MTVQFGKWHLGPGTILLGQVFEQPVSALDVAATAAELANIETKPGDLDGVNLIPFLTGKKYGAPHEFLAWRWGAQAAIRVGDWKLLRGGDREYLYELGSDLEEKHSLTDKHPDVADRLREKLATWASTLDPPGLADGGMSKAASDFFDYDLDGKPVAPLPDTSAPHSDSTKAKVADSGESNLRWVIRNGVMKQMQSGLQIWQRNSGNQQPPFITRNGLSLTGPVSVRVVAKTSMAGEFRFSWRTSSEKSFLAANLVSAAVQKLNDGQTIETTLPAGPKIVHVRIEVPGDFTSIKSIELKPTSGATMKLFQ